MSNNRSSAPPPVSVAVKANSYDIGNLTLTRLISVGDTTLDAPPMLNLKIPRVDSRVGNLKGATDPKKNPKRQKYKTPHF